MWNREETFNVTSNKYFEYVHIHFGRNVTIVFDGYTDYKKNTKAAEQFRQTIKTSLSSDVLFDQSITVSINQQQFLVNIHNKSRFNSMLCAKFTAANILVS